MKRKIIIGSRKSKLAMIYAERAKNDLLKNTSLNEEDILIKGITTKGDQLLDVRLSDFGGKGLFSNSIEKELEEKKIDIAVHALKDMPALENSKLLTNIFLKRNDPREVLISIDKKKLIELKKDSIVGTSSLRREFQIKRLRKDLKFKLIRGNVDTRLKKLEDGLYDAIILSFAGIKSLMKEGKVSEKFSTSSIVPSAGQGIIALQCRKNDKDIITLLKNINDRNTCVQAQAERSVLKVLGGDCETAVGVHATIEDDNLLLEAELFSLDGTERFYEKKSSKLIEAEVLGKEVGKLLKIKSKNSYKR